MKIKKIIQMVLLCIVACLPTSLFANSIEGYSFDSDFFTGIYIPSLYVHSDVHFDQGGNDFGGKMFFQDVKIIPLLQIGLSGNAEKNCYKQLRGFYINTARGNRVWPLDEDSLAHLQSVAPAYYNFMTITGGLFVCDYPSNGLVGYLQHTRKGEQYSLVVGTEYDFSRNTYLPLFASNGNFLFEESKTHGYLWDSYGGIAYVEGSGLDISYACGNGIVEDTEECDAGLQNGTIVGVCNDSCNGTTLSICGDGIVQSDYETCDSGSGHNGSAGYCNLACTSMIPAVVPPSSGGGGGGGSIVKDSCPTNRDCSSSYYDNICGPCVVAPPIGVHPVAVISGASVVGSPYSQELTQAYQWAFSVGITTVPTIQKANLTGTLLRKYAAKMIAQFAVNVLAKQPNDLFVCPFVDMANESLEVQYYARLACKLGIMGLQSNGSPDTKFNPNGEVTRAQFGTILSRLLYGDTYNGQPGKRYEAHLQALKAANIMTKISQPMMLELRGRVMLMLQRISK